MTDLPSLNSTTSLSDNVALRNYYDNLLFRNSSDKSLMDLPKKIHDESGSKEGEANNGSGDHLGGNNGRTEATEINQRSVPKQIDFIGGFRNPTYGSSLMDENSSYLSHNSDHGGPPPMSSGSSNVASPRPATTGPGSYRVSSVSNSDTLRQEAGGSANGPGGMPLPQGQHKVPHQMFSFGLGYDIGLDPDPVNTSTPMNHHPQPPFSFQSVVSGGLLPPSSENSLASGSGGPSQAGPPSLGLSGFYGVFNHQASGGASAGTTLSPINSAGSNLFASYVSQENHPFASTRRSSYISDQLIHGQPQQMQHQTLYEAGSYNGMNIHSLHQVQNSTTRTKSSSAQSQQDHHHHQQQQQQQQQQHRQPQGQSHHASSQQSQAATVHRNRGAYPQKHASVPQINYTGGSGSAPSVGIDCGGLNNNANKSSALPASAGNATDAQVNSTLNLDNGLILCNGQIVSSQDLRQIYRNSSGHYFSAKECFKFIDNLKDILLGEKSGSRQSSLSGPLPTQREIILRFVGFLKSCNLNYNPQSDAFVSTTQHRRSSTSSYLHYKPLVLVALKNGKLELLSIPQSTNLNMTREDLVIIDGDRGKDLAMVIEPKVDIDLALFINFLKKKIHFDSLITAVDQHYPNERFIQALMDSTNNGSGKDELNHKLYDVMELTQLIIPSKQVLRFATPWEVSTNLHNKFQDELKALHIAQLKLKSLNSGISNANGAAPSSSGSSDGTNKTSSNPTEMLTNSLSGSNTSSSSNNSNSANNVTKSLNIKILNAEFQFDRKKLTFYYVCQERNDFRELIKELFKFYKTRIWLCAIPNNLGIDKKYYDEHKKEWAMYQEMMRHYASDELVDANMQGGFIVAPPLHEIELDNFQLGVYKELVSNMFPS